MSNRLHRRVKRLGPATCEHTAQYSVSASVQSCLKNGLRMWRVVLTVKCATCGQHFRFFQLGEEPVSPDQKQLAWPIEPCDP